MTRQFFIFLVMMLTLAAGIVTVYMLARKRMGKKALHVNYNQRTNHFAYVFYRVLSSCPLTRKYYGKIRRKYNMFYPADDISLNRRVTNLFIRAALVAAACMIVLVLLARGDIFFMCFGIWFTMVVFTYVIDISFDQMETRLLTQFGDFLSSVRHYYHETNMLDISLYMALHDLPREIALHIQQIYEMVDSADSNSEVDRYAQKAPNRFLLTFSAICASIKEYGDKEVEGQSLFLTNCNYLKEELNIEILKKKHNEFLFAGCIAVSLIPVFLIKPIEYALSTNIAETKRYYNGAGGTISTIMVFFSSFIVYQMVSSMKNGRVDEMQEHNILQRLSKIPVIQHFLALIENHNYSRTLKIGDELKMTGDRIGTRAFLLKRFIVAVACMLLFNIFGIAVITNQKHDLKTNFTNAFENSVVPNADYRLIMEETAKEFAATYHYMGVDTKEAERKALAEQISKEKSIKPKYAEEIADLVMERCASARSLYYKWWLLILSMGIGVLGFYIPYWLLKYRVTIMRMSMEDEIAQFQTLILILMHEDGVTMTVILEWMERFSFCFKDSIQRCIVDLERNQNDALMNMRNAEAFPPFKRFVDNLLSVDNAGIEGAFSEIKTEREFYKNNRAEDNEIQSSQKASKANMICFIPNGCMLVGHIILPFASFAYNLYQEMSIIYK